MTDSDLIEDFLDAVCDGGSPVADCDLCKRVHFANSNAYYEEGELEKLEAKQKAEPDKYISHDVDAISWGCAFGHQFVWHCRCENAARIAKSVWAHRKIIAQFFGTASKRAQRDATELSESVEAILNLTK